MKRAEVLRRVRRWDPAREALHKAAALDEHDFLIVMRIGELGIEQRKLKISELIKAGKEPVAEKADLLKFETETVLYSILIGRHQHLIKKNLYFKMYD